MKIFIDDERFPQQVFWENLNLEQNNYHIVRNSFEFIQLITLPFLLKNELPKIICFDHDLADFYTNGQLNDLEKDIVQNQDEYALYKHLSTEDIINHQNILNDFIKYQHKLMVLNYHSNLGKKSAFEMNGFSILKFFVDKLMDKLEDGLIQKEDVMNIQLIFHTQNPIGKKNMESYWQNFLTSYFH